MTTARHLLTLCLVLACTLPATAALDEDRLLATIAEIECPGGWDGRTGPAGEASVWQITPRVWRQHMGTQPFRDAWNVLDAERCARLHLRWLAAGLQRHGYTPTPARLALAWNLGLTGALRREARLTDYARRAANLYAAR